MNYKLMALAVLSFSSVSAYDTEFAPYTGLYQVSIDTRFEGLAQSNCFDDIGKDLFNWTFKAYLQKCGRGFFCKMGTSVIGRKECSYNLRFNGVLCDSFGDEVTVPSHFHSYLESVDLQLGKYWEGVGALRVGLVSGGPGVGGDYWLMFGSRFKWLTTLELSGRRVFCLDRHEYLPFIKWLNRVFVLDGIYVSFGLDHTYSRQYSRIHAWKRTRGFIGLGVAL